ncbi:MFS transporter [Pediococcus pentosaceus]
MNKQKFGMILPIILISYFMILLDNSIVFTSTVKIAADLSLSASELSWVTNAYALTFGGLLMIGGRSGDIFGRRNVFLIGLVIFSSIGSLLVGLSTNGLMIIAMRALQGIGSAILAPTTLALLMDSYRDQMRTRAIVYYGATGGLGASIGLVVGGLIASYASWRWGFLLNVPVGILMIVLTLKYIPASKKVEGKLDWLGSILSVLGITALVYGINGASHPVPMVMTGILLLVLFVWQEKVSKHPITPLKLFKDRERSSAYIARFFFLGAMISYFFLTPQAMQQVYHFTPLMAAVGFLPETLPQFVFATLVSRLNEKFTNTQILIAGTVITLAGLVFAAVVGIQAGYWWSVAIPMVIIGIGQGFTLSLLTVAGVANTDKEIAGSASGVVNMVHQIGSSVGLSIITALTANLISPVLSYDHAIIIMVVFMLISVGATLNIGLKK